MYPFTANPSGFGAVPRLNEIGVWELQSTLPVQKLLKYYSLANLELEIVLVDRKHLLLFV